MWIMSEESLEGQQSPEPSKLLLNPNQFRGEITKAVEEAFNNESNLCLTFIQDPIVTTRNSTNEILNMLKPEDVKGEIGGGIGVISKQPPEELVRLAFRLQETFPGILVGVKVYRHTVDARRIGDVHRQAEMALQESKHSEGKVGVAGPINLRNFTLKERQKIRRVILEHK